MNSSGRERSNKLNIQTADWDAIILNIFTSIISESDLQRYNLGVNNMGMLEKMVSGGGRILDTIKLIIEYDISIISGTILRARIEMIREKLNNNLIIILEDRVLSSKLSDVLEDFKSMTVDNDDDVEESQLKKRKRNKCYCTEDVTYGFQSSIASNKKMDIVKCM